VSARAVDGRATEAALTAVADSFGVSRSAVRPVAGASSRTKIVDIDADDPRLLASLLAIPGRLPVTRYRSRSAVDHERSHEASRSITSREFCNRSVRDRRAEHPTTRDWI
jgi:hypothetical protein